MARIDLDLAHAYRPNPQRDEDYALLPLKAPEAARARLSETVQRVNWGLPHGNFEFDVDDGELRFKTSAFLTGDVVVADALEALLFANTATVDRYLPAFTSVIVQGAAPRDAVASVDTDSATGR